MHRTHLHVCVFMVALSRKKALLAFLMHVSRNTTVWVTLSMMVCFIVDIRFLSSAMSLKRECAFLGWHYSCAQEVLICELSVAQPYIALLSVTCGCTFICYLWMLPMGALSPATCDCKQGCVVCVSCYGWASGTWYTILLLLNLP